MTVLFVAALEDETGAFPDDVDLLHVGVGKVQAAATLAHHLATRASAPTLIVNVGTAGALDQLQVGEVAEVATVLQHDLDLEAAAAFVGRELPGGPLRLDAPPDAWARLATGDQVVADPDERARLAAHADLVDMEGYAIAAVSARFGIPVRIAKAVSDSADDDAERSWRETLATCSESLGGWAHDHGLL